ncbi:hypothetical protein NDU88_003578 [Pleurodeles waltl]|uniref:Uncharacterized protein n=1 Tax=Pleurodeles waltl TaxID=8319 RepID=A0AAV7T671_PLEWA|nr:hypothetical protein NDU88_003578 [Pleurodeles waltl]
MPSVIANPNTPSPTTLKRREGKRLRRGLGEEVKRKQGVAGPIRIGKGAVKPLRDGLHRFWRQEGRWSTEDPAPEEEAGIPYSTLTPST